MIERWRSRFVLGLSAVGLLAAGPSAQDAWKEGEPLPSLRLPTIDGSRTIDLASLRGTRLLLIEFASW